MLDKSGALNFPSRHHPRMRAIHFPVHGELQPVFMGRPDASRRAMTVERRKENGRSAWHRARLIFEK
jgi:hypothetical protein